MNYEQKYNEALERMKSWAKGEHPECFSEAQKTAEFIFPELMESESEDEWIKDDIKDVIQAAIIPKESKREMLAWLEKQGEQTKERFTWKPSKEQIAALRWVLNNVPYNKHKEEINGLLDQIKDIPQKDFSPIEPKFKVSDWLQYRYAEPFLVEEVTEQGYCNGNSCLPFEWEDEIHLWTINDAKDGDVLIASDDSIFLFAGVVDWACKYYVALADDSCVEINKEAKGGYWETSRAVHPATKEQRDLLFQKMKEAGYEWDAEKKELKKVEPKTLETRGNQVTSEIIKNQREMPGEFTKLVHENFWDLIKTEHKMLDADKVIEWLDEHVPTKFEDMANYVQQFKEDFGL